jgi:hypothetical protein
VIKQRNGEPRPQPPPDRNLRNWSAHLIGGKRMPWLGYAKAATAPAAIEAVVSLFGLDDHAGDLRSISDAGAFWSRSRGKPPCTE